MDSVQKSATSFILNPYVSATLTLFLILYGSLAAPQLPVSVMNLFDNAGFRLLVLVGIAFFANRNLQVALLVAIVFIITMNVLNEQRIVEGFLARQEFD